MSASEKLKALLHEAETSRRPWDNDIHGEPLLLALPQIAALAEAAEKSACNAAKTKLGKAVVALDEVLG